MMLLRGGQAVSVGICFVFVVQTWAAHLPLNDEELVSVHLTEEHSSREKRSDGRLADNINVQLSLNSGNVQLRLKRSKLVNTITSTGAAYSEDEDHSGVYSDVSSAFIVKREAGEYKLTGVFAHKGKQMEISHVAKRSAKGTRNHKVQQLRRALENVINVLEKGDVTHQKRQEPETVAVQEDAGAVTDTAHSNPKEIVDIRNEQKIVKDTSNDKRRALKKLNMELTRDKRQTGGTEHVIEMSFIADFTDYTWFLSFYPNNAIAEMRTWYTYLAEQINIRYQTIEDSRFSISTKVLKLYILQTDDDTTSFITDLADATTGQFDGGDGLAELSDFVEAVDESVLPTSDHYMYFTQLDIIGAAGIAYSSRVCTFSGVSITENTRQANMGGIAAHELGHSLSADHDRDTSDCSDDDEFIMSAVLSTPVNEDNTGNPYKFSPCSIEAFYTYLSGKTCTLAANTGDVDALPAPPFGEVMDRDTQCRVYWNDSSTFYCDGLQEQLGIDQLCRGMFCDIPNEDIGYCRYILPQEYTPCGTDSWCVAGLCVAATEVTVPTQPPTEPSTQPPTEPSTQPPTEPSTQPPTEPSTQPPTEPSTEPPTGPALSTTEAPTVPPTQPPTTQKPRKKRCFWKKRKNGKSYKKCCRWNKQGKRICWKPKWKPGNNGNKGRWGY